MVRPQVITPDIVENSYSRSNGEEEAIALIDLADKQLPRSEVRVATQSGAVSTNEVARVSARIPQDGRRHRGGRRLPVRAGNADAGVAVKDARQRVQSMHYWKIATRAVDALLED